MALPAVYRSGVESQNCCCGGGCAAREKENGRSSAPAELAVSASAGGPCGGVRTHGRV